MAIKATVKDTGISARKVKPIIDLVRGKNVVEALDILQFRPGPIAVQVAKLVRSARSNAENELDSSPNELKIVQIYANEGARTTRFRARARGRAARINRRSSHITVVVDE